MTTRPNPRVRVFLLDLEIDRFKDFNDIHGYTAGDELIRQVGNRLGTLAGTIGQVGRFGGGEFALILETTADPHEIEAVCDHLIETLSGTYNVNGIVAAITCSLGVVEIKENGSVGQYCAWCPYGTEANTHVWSRLLVDLFR